VVAYNFAEQFADAVKRGEKRQTIRKPRANGHAVKGNEIQLYTGQRTKDCRLLARGVCTLSTYCAIYEDGLTLGGVQPEDIDAFAKADGFASFEDMQEWFRSRYGLPFIGRLIRWDLVS
jgi:hypothetical protein